MSDMPPPAATVQPRWPLWAKVLLVMSLAVNLVIVGLVAGMALRGPDARRLPTNLAIEGIRDIARAMTPAERAALRADLRARRGELRAAREEMRAHNASFFAALRAEPFSTETLAAVLQVRSQTWAGLANTSREVLVARIAAMPEDERLAFADRLEAAVKRPRRPKQDDRDDK